jgi:hypothetical protein
MLTASVAVGRLVGDEVLAHGRTAGVQLPARSRSLPAVVVGGQRYAAEIPGAPVPIWTRSSTRESDPAGATGH